MLKYFLWWFPMLVIAIGNGALRDMWYKQFINELVAQQLSTILLMVLLGIYTWIIIAKFPPGNGTHAIRIGLMWTVFTLVFEFGFGYIRGHSWSSMLADYNITEGRLWLFIPIWIFILPYLCWLSADSAA